MGSQQATTELAIPESRKDWEQFRDELPNFADRTIVPSVSQVLAWEFGSPPNIDPVNIAMDRGKKIHHALQLKDEGKLTKWRNVDHAEMLGYIEQWHAFIQPGDEFLGIECPLFAKLVDIDYVVRPDRVIRRNGRTYVVDIKTKSAKGRRPDQKESLRNA